VNGSQETLITLAESLNLLSSATSVSASRLTELVNQSRSFVLQQGESVRIRRRTDSDYLYVISGAADIRVDGMAPRRVGPELAFNPPCPMGDTDTYVEVMALNDATRLYQIDRDKLDYLIFWDELIQASADENKELRRRMEKIQNSLALRRLPAENVIECLRRMQSQSVVAGDEIITQGKPGTTFYMIDEGEAEVWKQDLYDDAPQMVCRLKPGDTFGEEALVTGGTRNASVRMITPGKLLVLEKEDFTELFSASMVAEVEAELAKSMMEKGYTLLDVRYEEEFEESHIPGCTLLPLNELRNRVDELNPEQKYLVYCRSGKRSAVATLLLTQRGFKAVSMIGGIRDWPFEKKSLW